MSTHVETHRPATRTRRALRRAARPRPRVPSFCFDRDYWLGHCEGYRIDDARGRLGVVEAVERDAGATVLAIRIGLLGSRVLRVAADDVAFIVPRARRIWLGSGAATR